MKKIVKSLSMLILVAVFAVIAASVAYAEEDILETTLQVQVESDEGLGSNETLEEYVNPVETPTEENQDDASDVGDELSEENLENNIIDEETVPENTTDLIDNQLEVTEPSGDNQNNNCEGNPNVISAVTDGSDDKTEYMVTFESPDGKRFSIDGGSQIDLKEVLSQLWDDVPEAEMSIDESSIDGNCYKIENNIFSDLGPFTQAEKNLVVYIGNNKYEITIKDPDEISKLSDLTPTGGGTEFDDPYYYTISKDSIITGTLEFTEKVSGQTTYYKLDFNNTNISDNGTTLFKVGNNVTVTICNAIISGIKSKTLADVDNGSLYLEDITIKKIDNDYSNFIDVNGGTLTLRNVKIEDVHDNYAEYGEIAGIDSDYLSGFIKVVDGTLDIENSIIKNIYDNDGDYCSGFIYTEECVVTIRNVAISDVYDTCPDYCGSFLYFRESNVQLNGVTINNVQRNTANNSVYPNYDPLYYQYYPLHIDSSDCFIIGCEFSNIKGDIHSIIYTESKRVKTGTNNKIIISAVTGKKTTFENNDALKAVISLKAGLDIELDVGEGTEIINNNGRGIYADGGYGAGTVAVYGATISGNKTNSAESGGGIYASCNLELLSRAEIVNNEAGLSGGGVYFIGDYTRGYGGNLTLYGATISENTATNGPGGALSVNGCKLVTINNSKIHGNSSGMSGGGLSIYNCDEININSAEILNNTANFGGAICSTDSSINIVSSTIRNSAGGSTIEIDDSILTITSCNIEGNTSNNSSTINISAPNESKSVVNINGTSSEKTVISGNKAIATENQGTAVLHIFGNVDCTIENTDIINNFGSTCGGITAVATSTYNPIIKINKSNISNNKSSGCGGGLLLSVEGTDYTIQGTKLYVENTTICGNTANGGGAIWGLDADITLSKGTVVSNNSASTGAIDLTYSTLIVSGTSDNHVTVSNNAGGIFLYNCKNTIIENSDIYGNKALSGGGIYAVDSDVRICDTDIYNNTSECQAGGIYCGRGTAEIKNTRIFSNIAGTHGGGIASESCELEISDSEIFNNIATTSGGGITSASDVIKITSSKIYNNIASNNLAAALLPSHISQFIQEKNDGGGGLSVSLGIAELKDVEIFGNNANELCGGGMFCFNNQTILNNTKITNNSTNNDGAGVFAKYNEYNVGQSLTHIEETTIVYDNIKNGSQNNVFLTRGTVLTLKDLSSNAKIGVSTEEAATYDEPITISAGETEPYEYAFVSDSQNYYISNPRSGGKYIIKLCAYNSDTPGGYIPVIDKVDEDEEDEEEESEDTEEKEEEEIVAISTEYFNPGNSDSDQMEKVKAERRAKIVKAVWFTINLLCTIITVAISALTFAGKNKNSNMGLKLLSLLPAISLILMLVLSYPYGGTDTVADAYTLVFVITTAIQCGIGYLAWKNGKIFEGKNNINK